MTTQTVEHDTQQDSLLLTLATGIAERARQQYLRDAAHVERLRGEEAQLGVAHGAAVAEVHRCAKELADACLAARDALATTARPYGLKPALGPLFDAPGEVVVMLLDAGHALTAALHRLSVDQRCPASVKSRLLWLDDARRAAGTEGNVGERLQQVRRMMAGLATPDFLRWARLGQPTAEDPDPTPFDAEQAFAKELVALAEEHLPVLRALESDPRPAPDPWTITSTYVASGADKRRTMLIQVRSEHGDALADFLRDVLRSEGLGRE